MTRQISTGMVGGGPGAGIAQSHRIAMRTDNRYALVAGVFSRDPEKSAQMAQQLAVDHDRLYPDPATMAEQESQRGDGIRCVVIVTPHKSHFEIARAFVTRGIHVICDKPLTTDAEEARALARLVGERRVVFAVTHNYTGYPMIRQAAHLVRSGELGEVRLVQVEHAHGRQYAPQQNWRTDPAVADIASAMFDLGTHAHNLVRFVTGLEVSEVSAAMNTLVPGRQILDNANVNLRLDNGAVGSLWASMAATGHEHGLRLRVYCARGSVEWRHEDPQHLLVRSIDSTVRTLAQGQPALHESASRHRRAGLGHPEGIFSSFANLYADAADEIEAREAGAQFRSPAQPCPDVHDGVAGVLFVDAVKRSHFADGAWTGVATR